MTKQQKAEARDHVSACRLGPAQLINVFQLHTGEHGIATTTRITNNQPCLQRQGQWRPPLRLYLYMPAVFQSSNSVTL